MQKDDAGDAPSAPTTRARHRKGNSDVCLYIFGLAFS